ncbi:MAG: hypothetical protein H6686_07645 [Fibrobacteria bacterium]|nr:hypothetical protein [Fibrobacteria bacterium]
MNPWIWIVLLQILAVALLVAEVFVPSGGLLMIFTLMAAGGSIWTAFDLGATQGWWVLAADVFLLPLAGWKALETIPRTSAALQATVEGRSGDAGLANLVGALGTCQTDLRPVGRVKVGDLLVDAQMAHGFLAAGSSVRVTRFEAGHLFVEPAEPPLPPA